MNDRIVEIAFFSEEALESLVEPGIHRISSSGTAAHGVHGGNEPRLRSCCDARSILLRQGALQVALASQGETGMG
jgi:hypothetical protein